MTAAILSCSDSNSIITSDNESKIETVSSVTYSIDKFSLIEDRPQIQTKVALESETNIIWNDGDTVGIYPNTGAQVYFSIESGGAEYASFDGGGWSFKTGSTYSAYYPFIGDIYLDRECIPVCFSGQEQFTPNGTAHLGSHLFMYSEPTSVSEGNLNFSFKHLCCIIRATVTLPAGTYTKFAITAPTDVFVKKGSYNLAAGNCTIAGSEYTDQIQINLDNCAFENETQFKIYIAVAPVNLNGTEITVSVLDSQKKELQCKKTPSKAYSAGNIYGLSCSTWTEVPQSMGMIVKDWDDAGTISGDAQ